nr:ABC transporter substrate-binding protein [uncultured Desulfobacter sp.]
MIWTSILRGRIDAAFSLSSNEKRRQACYFPNESLVDSQWVLFIRKEDEGKITFTSWNDLKGKKISVVLAYAYPPEFLKFLETEQNFETVIHDRQGFQMLNARRVDFVAAEYGNALALLEELKLSDQILPLLDHPISTMKLYIAFNKQTVRQQLVDNFSATLKIFKTTPAYEQLYKKYFER